MFVTMRIDRSGAHSLVAITSDEFSAIKAAENHWNYDPDAEWEDFDWEPLDDADRDPTLVARGYTGSGDMWYEVYKEAK